MARPNGGHFHQQPHPPTVAGLGRKVVLLTMPVAEVHFPAETGIAAAVGRAREGGGAGAAVETGVPHGDGCSVRDVLSKL